ncbi:MAG: hypothetical protein NC302_06465 [Bacteroidales bacterium]|nr:hypothetical protein [Bacteroidales bacterium]
MRKFEDKYLISRNFNFNSDLKFTTNILKGSIVHTYETLDMIDQNLVNRGSQKLSSLVELANLSSIVGNLLGAGCAEYSQGAYYRNRPHTYPDLVAANKALPGIEIKTAILKNSPKGHQPKPGYYLTYRYCLTDENGYRNESEKESWDTVTIWEVKLGYLNENDFSCSNTEGDSGKTAVIKTTSLNAMPLLYFDPTLVPYKHSLSKPYKGYN